MCFVAFDKDVKNASAFASLSNKWTDEKLCFMIFYYHFVFK